MEQQSLYSKPIYAVAAAFDPHAPEIAFMCSNASITFWNTENNSLTNVYLPNLAEELRNQKIHSINYTHDNDSLEIMAFKPLSKLKENLITVTYNFTKEINKEFPTKEIEISVQAKKFTVNLRSHKIISDNIDNFICNKRSHNAVHILTSQMVLIGYEKEKKEKEKEKEEQEEHKEYTNRRFKGEIAGKLTCCELQRNKDNQPRVAAGFRGKTHIHNLNNIDHDYEIQHPDRDSTVVAFSPNCSQFLLGTSDGLIGVYSFPDQEPQASATESMKPTLKREKEISLIPSLEIPKPPIEFVSEQMQKLINNQTEQSDQITLLNDTLIEVKKLIEEAIQQKKIEGTIQQKKKKLQYKENGQQAIIATQEMMAPKNANKPPSRLRSFIVTMSIMSAWIAAAAFLYLAYIKYIALEA
jgi:hypothetical protein